MKHRLLYTYDILMHNGKPVVLAFNTATFIGVVSGVTRRTRTQIMNYAAKMANQHSECGCNPLGSEPRAR